MKRTICILLFCISITTTVSAQIKIGSHVFKDGAEYVGELKGKRPHGKGKTVFKNGDIYEGNYVKGKRQGEGTYTFHDGEKYVGGHYRIDDAGNAVISLQSLSKGHYIVKTNHFTFKFTKS